MDMIKNIILSLLTSLGILIGFFIAKYTKEEVLQGKKILLIVEKLFMTALLLSLIFLRNELVIILSLLFFILLIRGSLMFVQKRPLSYVIMLWLVLGLIILLFYHFSSLIFK